MSLDFKAVGKQLDALTDAEQHELDLLLKMKREQRHQAREAAQKKNHPIHDHSPR